MSPRPASTPSLQHGKRIPNWVVKDADGTAHTLWDYRQKSHLALLYDPKKDKETIGHWQQAITADQRQWEWLHVKILVVMSAPKDMEPGIYAIDRYGMLINNFPISNWSFDDLEREFLYYEAHHC